MVCSASKNTVIDVILSLFVLSYPMKQLLIIYHFVEFPIDDVNLFIYAGVCLSLMTRVSYVR